jgi:PqqD family protein of HPr-rel-A system
VIYCAPPSSALLHEPLDAFTAVFHRPSGITHLLVAPAPEILAALAPDGLTHDALLERLTSDYDLADPDADCPRAALEARLGELVAAGLVTQQDGAP